MTLGRLTFDTKIDRVTMYWVLEKRRRVRASGLRVGIWVRKGFKRASRARELDFNTGPIPYPRAGHTAVLVGDVMYVFGRCSQNGIYLGDLTALNLSSKGFGMFDFMRRSFTYNIQLSDGSRFKT
jgi:hypothetical protein